MAEDIHSLYAAIGNGPEEDSVNDISISSGSVGHGTPVIKHLKGQLEIHVDQITYQIVEESTKQACASLNTDDSTALMEQRSSIDDPLIVVDGAAGRQACHSLNTDDSTAPMEQGSSIDDPLIAVDGAAGRQACHSVSTDDSTAPMEQGSSIDDPFIAVDGVAGRQACDSLNTDDSTALMEQGSSIDDPLIAVDGAAGRQACHSVSADDSSAPMEQGSASINDPLIEHLTEQVQTVTYQVLEQGTRRARKKLIDSNGYTYNVKTQSPLATYWQCTIRPKLNRCRATVVQRGDMFRQGNHAHNHYAKTGAAAAVKIATIVKQEAVNNPLKPAAAIVNEVLLEELGGIPIPSLVNPDCLARTANRARQFSRPRDPTDLAFEVEEDHIPAEFLRVDIVKQGRRHLIFATREQTQLLIKAKSWYIDETFKFCQHPFKQLITISAFVSSDDDAKQMPLVFVLMSGSEKKDYRKVINKLLGLLPSAPSVREITVFFDEALWTVLRRVLPDANIKGCVLHWMQAAWRTIQELELQDRYNSDKETNLFLRKVMALPFLPQEAIQPMFVRLWVQATTAPLQLFIQYVSATWIYNTTWPPSTWSVFSTAVRTYKDVERWHPNLNRRLSGKRQMPFYLLIRLLHKEASYLTSLQVKPLSQKKLKRIRNKRPSTQLAKFFHYWEEYNTQTKSVAQLLKACAEVSGLISV